MLATSGLDHVDQSDDDTSLLHEDPDRIQKISEAKIIYNKLRKGQRRMMVYQTNLEKKLQKLKNDLDIRTDEVEKLQRNLDSEQRKFEDDVDTTKREHEDKIREEEERIRDVLAEVLYAKPKSSNAVLDTVMVSFVRPSETFRYNLAFTVDCHTMVKELRQSACRYWGESAEEFVLLTMAGSKCQDDLLVKECFKQGEIAQLRLTKKRLDPTEAPTDDEIKAIMPKKTPKKKKQEQTGYDKSAVEHIQRQQEGHLRREMTKFGGAYFLMRTMPTKPSEHCQKIKLRDLTVYLLLVCLTFITYDSQRPSGDDYWLQEAFEDQVAKGWQSDDGSVIVPALGEIGSLRDLYFWLEYTLPSIVLPSESRKSLHSFNSMLGYASIRVQNIRTSDPPWQACSSNQAIVRNLSSLGAVCFPTQVTEDVEEKRDFVDLQAYWNSKLMDQAREEAQLRGPTPPWKWHSEEHNLKAHGIRSVVGEIQTYAGSGYMAEFRMSAKDKVLEYRRDVLEFQRLGWISHLSRLVVVAFTAYNVHLDRWVSTEVTFEMLPNEAVRAHRIVIPFRPNVMETQSELTGTYIDYSRLVFACYIFIFIGIAERHHKIKNHKAGCWYHVSMGGICDVGIVACIFCAALWRLAELSGDSTKDFLSRFEDPEMQLGFYTISAKAKVYLSLMCVEGVLMVFLMLRLITYARLSRRVFMSWQALGLAMQGLAYLMLLFAPTLIGIVFMAHIVYGPYLEEFAHFSTTMIQFFHILEGDFDFTELVRLNGVWAIILVIATYVVVSFILMNVLVMIVLDAFYVTHLTIAPGEAWGTMRKLKWVVPGILVNIYQSLAGVDLSEAT